MLDTPFRSDLRPRVINSILNLADKPLTWFFDFGPSFTSLGIPLDSLADILLGRGVTVPSAPRELKPPAPPPRPPPPPGGNRLLQIVEEARQRQHNLTTEILGLLQWKEAPEFPVQQREADAISWSLRIGTKEFFSITDNFGSTALILSCRLGMEQLCYVMLTAPGILPEAMNRTDQEKQLSVEIYFHLFQ